MGTWMEINDPEWDTLTYSKYSSNPTFFINPLETCNFELCYMGIVEASTPWLVVNMHLVTWLGEIARIVVRPIELPLIRVQVSYKAHLVGIFKQYSYVTVQCSMHSSLRQYSALGFWLGIIHILIGLTLIIAVNRVESIRRWSFGKCGLNW